MYRGVGWLMPIDQNLTKEIYKTILEDDLRATIHFYDKYLTIYISQNVGDWFAYSRLFPPLYMVYLYI